MAGIVRSVSLPPSGQLPDDGRVTAHRVVFVVFPDFQILDLTGPHEVFSQVERDSTARQQYLVETVSMAGGPVRSSGGLTIGPTLAAADSTGRSTR